MLKFEREGIYDSQKQIAELKTKGHPLVYVGDVVGTGSSRKSATNSILWYMGDDIPCVPNKRTGGFVLGGAARGGLGGAARGDGRAELEHGRRDRPVRVR